MMMMVMTELHVLWLLLEAETFRRLSVSVAVASDNTDDKLLMRVSRDAVFVDDSHWLQLPVVDEVTNE